MYWNTSIKRAHWCHVLLAVILVSQVMTLSSTQAQTVNPVPIGCRDIDMMLAAGISTDYNSYNCLNSPAPNSGNAAGIGANSTVNFYAGEEINLGPDFEADALANNLEFTAQIRENDFEVVEFPTFSPGHVELYGKYELGLRLPEQIETAVSDFLVGNNNMNPYDPRKISIEATFEHSQSGSRYIRHGFFYEAVERDIQNNSYSDSETNYRWRVRFAPSEIGVWFANIRVVVNESVTLSVQNIPFACIDSDHKGWLERQYTGTNNDHYLKYGRTQETFFGIGENLNWGGFEGANLTPQTALTHLQRMEELADARGNLFRMGMAHWWYNIEWESLLNYHSRRTNMYEMDKVMETAEARKLYLLLHLEIHNDFMVENDFADNPYTTLSTVNPAYPSTFFESAEARKIYKYKLRYIHARWGYSPYLAFYELLSELDNVFEEYHAGVTQSHERDIFHDWFLDMKNHLQDELEGPQLVSASLEQGDDKLTSYKFFALADVSMLHLYDLDYKVNYKSRFNRTRNLLNTSNIKHQPVIHNESGTQHQATLDCCTDNPMHNAIWSTAMQGNFGCGMNWWWDFATHAWGYQENYRALAEFMEGENLGDQKYEPKRWRQGGDVAKEENEFEVFHLVSSDKKKALGWVHFQHYWWPNLYDQLDCVETLLSMNGGANALVCADPGNDEPYHDKYFANSFIPANDVESKVKIQNLKGLEHYIIEWWRTDGNGGPDGTYTVRKKTNIWGTLDLTYPDPGSDPVAPDWAVKIRIDDDRSPSYSTSDLINDESTDAKASELFNLMHELKVYPNPTENSVTVTGGDQPVGVQKLEVYNLQGQQIMTIDQVTLPHRIDLSNVPAGLYYVRVIDRTGKPFSTKIIKR